MKDLIKNEKVNVVIKKMQKEIPQAYHIKCLGFSLVVLDVHTCQRDIYNIYNLATWHGCPMLTVPYNSCPRSINATINIIDDTC